MKSKYTLKLITIGIISLIFFLVGATSCNQCHNKNMGEENTDVSSDSVFLAETAASNLIEIKITQLAQEKTSNDSIKDFAKMLERDHTNLYNDLQTLAKVKSIIIPTSVISENMKMYDEMKEKDEPEFDEGFCEMMVNKHKKSIAKFEKTAKESNDLDIRNFAISALPTLRNHLAMALRYQERYRN